MMFRMSNRLGSVVNLHTSVLLCLVLAGSLLTACGSKESSVQMSAQPSSATTPAASAGVEKSPAPSVERKVKDELGHEVTIPASPKRIFAPYLEDSLIKLNIKPVAQWANGNQGHAYLKTELKDVPTLDFSGGLPSPEKLLAYNPDFIILHTANYAGNGVYESYSKIAPTYVFSNATGDVEKSLVLLGELLGKSVEADKALQAYNKKVAEAKEKLSKVTDGKKAAIIRFAPKGVSLMGANYFGGYVVHQKLGIGKIKLVEKENSANVSMEILPQIDADYIFTVNASGQERLKEMTDSPIWQSMSAVKQGQAHQVDETYWLGGGLIAYEKIIDDTVKLLVK